MEVASTKTLRPSTSMTLSIMPAPFSNDMEYEKPEHPPPTTPTRSPAGTGFCCPMISLTLATAVGVRLMGGFFAVSSGIVSCGRTGVVVVAMSLLGKIYRHYNRRSFHHTGFKFPATHPVYIVRI